MTGRPLPPQVELLAAREREVATIVYLRGAQTAKDVRANLSLPVSDATVRTMLKRLIRKGILTRRWGGRGRGQQYLYGPVVTPEHVKRAALRQIAQHYFEGSLFQAAMTILELLGPDEHTDERLQKLRVRAKRGTSEAPLI